MASPSPLLTPTYANALHLLSLLQSNKTIISLFATSPAPTDINASALPEMRAWLARAGYPAPATDLAALRVIHVAGTKGKGSVCAFTTAILRQYPQAAGKVGTYTSPHLVTVRERICVDGAPLTQERFAVYFFELWNRLSDAARAAGDEVGAGEGEGEGEHGLGLDGPGTKPFYFRFLTLLALHVFVREGVTSAVVECGIGGEYDSTNVLPPEVVTVSAVTKLGIDHVNMLGDTVEKIAWHKAGIFKKDTPAYTYQSGRPTDGSDEVLKLLHERAEEKGTSLTALTDKLVNEWDGVQDAHLEGAFQKGNMALASAIARQHLQSLTHNTFDANTTAPLPSTLATLPAPFTTGLQTARLRGRCETLRTADGITWYLDGAHTTDSLAQVGAWFATKIGAEDSIRILVFNQQDRATAPTLLRTLLDALQAATGSPNRKIFHHAFCPTNEPATSSSGKTDMSVQRRNCDVVRQFCPFTAAIPADSVGFALDMARNVMLGSEKSKDGFKVQVLVTGSFNLVGPALRLLEPGSEP